MFVINVIFCLIRDEDVRAVLEKIIKEANIDMNQPANVFFARDTR